jgi:hypothetical protein
MCTVKKEKTIFLIYKDIQKRLGAVIYEKGLPNMCGKALIFSHI